jgi:protocatechuate 3,4-dioxygenase beta subunit
MLYGIEEARGMGKVETRSAVDRAPGVDRRGALSRLGSVVAVGFLGGCGGGESDSPTGATSQTSSTSSSTTSTNTQCVVTPELTEGPYFVDEMLNRSDIRTDPATGTARSGVPLTLELVLSQVGASGCGPLAGALVDVWHCDASGLYSDVAQQRTGGQAFLRGYQLSDAGGSARFTTIYPGWYPGRAVHVHFKVRTTPAGSRGLEMTSQLFFDEALTDQVYTQPPYSQRGRRDTLIGNDGIFRSGGTSLLVPLSAAGGGYSGRLYVGVRV